jgi:hypothetical protein
MIQNSAGDKGAFYTRDRTLMLSSRHASVYSVFFLLHFFALDFPFDQAPILAFILFVVGWLDISEELRMCGLLPNKQESQTQPESPTPMITLTSIGPSQGSCSYYWRFTCRWERSVIGAS